MPWRSRSAIRSAWAWAEPSATSCRLAMPDAVESGLALNVPRCETRP